MENIIEIDTSNEQVLSESQIAETATNLITNGVSEEILKLFTEKANAIVVKDWEDKDSIKAAKDLKSSIKSLTDKLDRRRIDVKQAIEDQAQIIIQQFKEPIKYLDSQIAIRTDELKRQKEEEEKRIQDIISERSKLISAEGGDVQLYFLHPEACNEEKFEKLLAKVKEEKKLKEEAAEREAAQKAEFDAKVKAQEEENRRLKAENEALKDENLNVKYETVKPVLQHDNQIGEDSEKKKRYSELYAEFPTYHVALLRIIELEIELEAERKVI